LLSSAVVLPLFVIANAGVDLSPSVLHSTEAASVFVALLIARSAGKVVGIAGTVYVLRSVGLMRFGPGLTMAKIIGASLLCGVGFTVPLLYASVAFAHHEELFAATQLGLLVASVLGVIGGLLVLSRVARQRVPLSDGD
jgi:Na+/H+ antiporter NhaA